MAVPLLLVQYTAVALLYWRYGAALEPDAEFWLLPLHRIGQLSAPTATDVALLFGAIVLSYAALGALSFRRAARSDLGFSLAVASILPCLQLVAVPVLACLPVRRGDGEAQPEEVPESNQRGVDAAHVLQGLFAGMFLIVAAVLISAVTFGAYGWGLFVMTPFMVGVATAYLANRRNPLDLHQTNLLVSSALGLGGLALLLLALEGAVCIVLLAPLALGLALIGGVIGRGVALQRNSRDKPLMAVALLPLVFALEAAMPPSAAIASQESIDIAAPAPAVWRAMTSGADIAEPPGLVGRAGLAYPLRGKLLGSGVGAVRIGVFSTGLARERVTEWVPGRRLAFRVLSQPPAMEEMSPYRRVHAPHVSGYFETGETRFTLTPLPGGGTRLTVAASHVLRIDPIPYWEPLARWAASANSRRVLADLKRKAERGG
ncbi:MAG TPA: SRPBCC family protein [Allosphingosinicella sp.]|jgi:hypothetical protein